MTLAGGVSDLNAANCDVACGGKLAENCGGHNTLNLYISNTPYVAPAAPAMAGGYNYVGCQTDGINGIRALTAQAYAQPGMTNEVCATFCTGYLYFGTEYGDECHCGSTLNPSSVPTPATDCSMPCARSKTELCGAGNRMNMYISAGYVAPSATSAVVFSSSALLIVSSSVAPLVVPSSMAAPVISSSAAPLVTSSSAAPQVVSSSLAPQFISSSVGAPVVSSSAAAAAPVVSSSAAPKVVVSSSAPIVHSSTVAAPVIYSTSIIIPVLSSTAAAAIVPSSSSIKTSTRIKSSTAATVLVRSSSSLKASTFKTSTITKTSTRAALVTPFSYIECFSDIAAHNIALLTTSKTMNPSICMSIAKAALIAPTPITYHYVSVEARSECLAVTIEPASLTSMTSSKACTSTCARPAQSGATGVQYCGGKLQYNLYASMTGGTISGPVATQKALVAPPVVAVAGSHKDE